MMNSFPNRYLLLSLLFCFAFIRFQAQTETQKVTTTQSLDFTPGVIVYADSAITNLEKRQRYFKETRGFRIQIFLGSFENAKGERSKYMALGLPYSAYLKQVVPEHALQVGDFISRLEMEKHLEIVRQYYPKSFGVVEYIEPPKFQSSRKNR